jgi:hypothetical protein
MSSQTNDEFVSKLDKNNQRFLAHVVVHGLAVGRRTPVDFIRHFSPSTIMKGLDARPHLRADILEITTGVNRKVALKKSAGSAGEDVQIALDEGVTSAEQIVRVFHPDDRVRHLDNKKLWSYVVEGDFWAIDPNSRPEFERAKEHVAFILDRALIDRLITHEDLIEGVTVEKLAECLPRAQLAQIIKAALELGRNKKPFSEEELLRASASRVIVDDISLRHIWETVVVPRIARAHGFEDEPRAGNGAATTAKPAEVKTEPARSGDAKAEAKTEAKPADAKAEAKPDNGKAAEAKDKDGHGKTATAAKASGGGAKITAPGKTGNGGQSKGGSKANNQLSLDGDPPTQEEEIEVLHVDDDDFDDFPPEPTDVGVRTLPRE